MQKDLICHFNAFQSRRGFEHCSIAASNTLVGLFKVSFVDPTVINEDPRELLKRTWEDSISQHLFHLKPSGRSSILNNAVVFCRFKLLKDCRILLAKITPFHLVGFFSGCLEGRPCN